MARIDPHCLHRRRCVTPSGVCACVLTLAHSFCFTSNGMTPGAISHGVRVSALFSSDISAHRVSQQRLWPRACMGNARGPSTLVDAAVNSEVTNLFR
jgi:hypothetical protein